MKLLCCHHPRENGALPVPWVDDLLGTMALCPSQELCCCSLGHTLRKATENKVVIICYINVGCAMCSLGTPSPAQDQGASASTGT